jgi:hypothetical protein
MVVIRVQDNEENVDSVFCAHSFLHKVTGTCIMLLISVSMLGQKLNLEMVSTIVGTGTVSNI